MSAVPGISLTSGFDSMVGPNAYVTVLPLHKQELEFSIHTDAGSFAVLNWDDEIDVRKLLGDSVSEHVPKLGVGADTFAVSYVKEMKYEDLELKWMSPRDDGKIYRLFSIVTTIQDILTAEGSKQGIV